MSSQDLNFDDESLARIASRIKIRTVQGLLLGFGAGIAASYFLGILLSSIIFYLSYLSVLSWLTCRRRR